MSALARVETDATLALGASQTGAVALRTLDDVARIAGAFAKSGMFADVRDASQAVVKILAGAEMGFSPIASMNGVYIVKGRVSMGAGLIAAAIKRHPGYDFRVREHTDQACRIEFFEVDPRTGKKEPLGEASFTAADAKRAGTQNMGRFPKNMLYARALTNGARWHTPDVFGGPVYTPDELGQEVDDDGVPVGLEAAEVLEDSGEPARQLAPAPEAEDAEVLDAPDPDALAALCAERLALVDSADEETLNAWYAEARAEWPGPLRERLHAAIRAEAARRKGDDA